MAGMSKTQPEARLLVVEDDPNILELLSASLRLAGFEVATATGGLEALTGQIVKVNEIACCANGAPHCEFDVQHAPLPWRRPA